MSDPSGSMLVVARQPTKKLQKSFSIAWSLSQGAAQRSDVPFEPIV